MEDESFLLETNNEEDPDDSEELTGSNKNHLLKQFIEVYETLPELWNTTSVNYMNKTKRNTALDKLLVIYKKINDKATRADVRRKINTLRSNFRKELKKIVTSKRLGAGTDEIYVPTSWTWHALQFLRSTENPVRQNSSQENSGAGLNEDQHESVEQTKQGQPDCEAHSTHSRSSIDTPPVPGTIAKRKRTVGSIARQNELLQKACSYLEGSNVPQKSVPTAAVLWGEKLEALDPHQRVFAEKGINDILFEGSLGTLNRNSIKINEPISVVTSPSSGSCKLVVKMNIE